MIQIDEAKLKALVDEFKNDIGSNNYKRVSATIGQIDGVYFRLQAISGDWAFENGDTGINEDYNCITST